MFSGSTVDHYLLLRVSEDALGGGTVSTSRPMCEMYAHTSVATIVDVFGVNDIRNLLVFCNVAACYIV